MVIVLLAKTAGCSAQAFTVNLNICTHLTQRRGETEAVFIHGFVDDGQAFGLSESNDEGLLPVRHETGVNGGFQSNGMQFTAGMIEANTF